MALLKEQYAGTSIRVLWGTPRYCWQHHEEIEETLGYCWRCLAEEVDPPDQGYGSWWWRFEGYDFCVCREPQGYGAYCLRCQLPLPERGSLWEEERAA